MRLADNWPIALATIITGIALATCTFGVRYEINRISPAVLAQMGDTDWVGAEWVFRGMAIAAVAIPFAALWLVVRVRRSFLEWKQQKIELGTIRKN